MKTINVSAWWKEITQKAINRGKDHKGDLAVGEESEEFGLIGVCGEYAVAFDREIPFSQIRDDIPRGDEGWDLVTPAGKKLEIKTAGKDFHKYAMSRKNYTAADYVVGCKLNQPERLVTIMGWVPKDVWEQGLEPGPKGGNQFAFTKMQDYT